MKRSIIIAGCLVAASAPHVLGGYWGVWPVTFKPPVLQMERGGVPYFIHPDHIGNTRALSDAAGQVVETYAYDDFGEAVIFDAMGQPVLPGQEVGNPYMFHGARRDAETGFYWCNGRYYEPGTGRFTSRRGNVNRGTAVGNPGDGYNVNRGTAVGNPGDGYNVNRGTAVENPGDGYNVNRGTAVGNPGDAYTAFQNSPWTYADPSGLIQWQRDTSSYLLAGDKSTLMPTINYFACYPTSCNAGDHSTSSEIKVITLMLDVTAIERTREEVISSGPQGPLRYDMTGQRSFSAPGLTFPPEWTWLAPQGPLRYDMTGQRSFSTPGLTFPPEWTWLAPQGPLRYDMTGRRSRMTIGFDSIYQVNTLEIAGCTNIE